MVIVIVIPVLELLLITICSCLKSFYLTDEFSSRPLWMSYCLETKREKSFPFSILRTIKPSQTARRENVFPFVPRCCGHMTKHEQLPPHLANPIKTQEKHRVVWESLFTPPLIRSLRFCLSLRRTFGPTLHSSPRPGKTGRRGKKISDVNFDEGPHSARLPRR